MACNHWTNVVNAAQMYKDETICAYIDVIHNHPNLWMLNYKEIYTRAYNELRKAPGNKMSHSEVHECRIKCLLIVINFLDSLYNIPTI